MSEQGQTADQLHRMYLLSKRDHCTALWDRAAQDVLVSRILTHMRPSKAKSLLVHTGCMQPHQLTPY